MIHDTYVVEKPHTSEYPNPITFTEGAVLHVGETYAGPEDWDNWVLCQLAGQEAGWVPAQIIEMLDADTGRATEDYTARELDVRPGESLVVTRTLNGWAWCSRPGSTDSGWVPLANLRPTSSQR
jgi:hypothetical protein